MDEWIDCKKQLPKAEYGESSNVLTVSETDVQQVLYFDGSCWCYPDGEPRNQFTKITHWMPLPPSPKKQTASTLDGNDLAKWACLILGVSEGKVLEMVKQDREGVREQCIEALSNPPIPPMAPLTPEAV